MSELVQLELPGMPQTATLSRRTANGETVISFGSRLVFRYPEDDIGMRNMAIVALTDAKVSGPDAALLFGLTAPYISRVRGNAKRHGTKGLVRTVGRPPKLSARQVANVRRLAAAGETHANLATRYRVGRSSITELLGRYGPLPLELPLVPTEEPRAGSEEDSSASGSAAVEDLGSGAEPVKDSDEEATAPARADREGLARISTGTFSSRYAGASLLYPYLGLVGAGTIFSGLSGAPWRRYDDQSVLMCTVIGFALGIDTIEGAKHLRRGDAGAAVGMETIPELRTLRERLSALADGRDPLGLQRAFAKATLAADPPESPLYYLDDHFVAYTGGQPVAKGWNTRRRHAEPGRDDTLVCDDRGRAVLFSSGEPSGLSVTMLSVLDQLREVLGPNKKVMLGFDRGGSYPKAFAACRAVNMDWLTYRRGKLIETKVEPKTSWALRDGRRMVVRLADETVELNGYGKARQLTLFETGIPVLQVLTSDMTASGAQLLVWLRGRWSIENFFKYAAQHNGIDSISSYQMDKIPDLRLVPNPKRKVARDELAVAESDLALAERALAQLLCDRSVPCKETNSRVRALQDRIKNAEAAIALARCGLAGIRAKVPAADLQPGAERATMRIERRGLQMVCRLLAYNAESWLAEHFDAYLADPNENRAIVRNLLHLGGSFSYDNKAITVTLDRPDSPRVARALELLADELSASDARIPGDSRPLSYRVSPAQN
jgi:hypothetical protein